MVSSIGPWAVDDSSCSRTKFVAESAAPNPLYVVPKARPKGRRYTNP